MKNKRILCFGLVLDTLQHKHSAPLSLQVQTTRKASLSLRNRNRDTRSLNKFSSFFFGGARWSLVDLGIADENQKQSGLCKIV